MLAWCSGGTSSAKMFSNAPVRHGAEWVCVNVSAKRSLPTPAGCNRRSTSERTQAGTPQFSTASSTNGSRVSVPNASALAQSVPLAAGASARRVA